MIALCAAGASGIVTWTLLEYIIHRWGGHDRRLRRSPFGTEHVRHHIEGDYFSPAIKKVAVVSLVTGAAIVLARALVGTGPGIAYVGGLVACYALYEWFHRRLHTHAGSGRYGRWARRHHFAHHLVDARANFGVTSPIWDIVFRTYRVATTISVPPRLAMRWLLDPETGQVHSGHADTYVLR